MPTTCWIPEDLMINVLMRLPVKSLLRFRCVSKSWHNCIDSEEFVNAHLARSMKDKEAEKIIFGVMQFTPGFEGVNRKIFTAKYDTPENFKSTLEELYNPPCDLVRYLGKVVVGSCNGLVCMWNTKEGLILLNPSTRQYCMLPHFTDRKLNELYVEFGFGYDDVSEDYKVVSVVRICGPSLMTWRCEVSIYSLKSNNWRTVDKLKYYDLYGGTSAGILVNGAVHFLLTRHENFGNIVNCVFALDLRSEKCRFVPLLDDQGTSLEITNLEGCLSAITYHPSGRKANYAFWKMKDYGVKDSWTKITSVQVPLTCFRWRPPISFSEGDKQLIYYQKNVEEHTEERITWYNYQLKRYQNVSIPNSNLSALMREVTCFIPSLVQPKSKYGGTMKWSGNEGHTNLSSLKRSNSTSSESSSSSKRRKE